MQHSPAPSAGQGEPAGSGRGTRPPAERLRMKGPSPLVDGYTKLQSWCDDCFPSARRIPILAPHRIRPCSKHTKGSAPSVRYPAAQQGKVRASSPIPRPKCKVPGWPMKQTKHFGMKQDKDQVNPRFTGQGTPLRAWARTSQPFTHRLSRSRASWRRFWVCNTEFGPSICKCWRFFS